jgi:TfoX/Sxy family transcriptional regulator of competence genes
MKLFEALVATAPGAKVKPMFGNFAVFKDGTMFAGIFGDQVFVRLAEADRAKAVALPGAQLFEPMKGRPMKEYVCMPAAVLADKKKTSEWVAKSLAFAKSVPRKKGSKKSTDALALSAGRRSAARRRAGTKRRAAGAWPALGGRTPPQAKFLEERVGSSPALLRPICVAHGADVGRIVSKKGGAVVIRKEGAPPRTFAFRAPGRVRLQFVGGGFAHRRVEYITVIKKMLQGSRR